MHRISKDDYAKEVQDGFSENAPDEAKRLHDAMLHLKEAVSLMDWKYCRNLVTYNGETVWVPSDPDNRTAFDLISEPDGASSDLMNTVYKAMGPGRDYRRMRVLVYAGAEAEYDVQARRHRTSSVVAGVMYCTAIGFILWLIIAQTIAVARSAGWIGS